MKFKIGDRVRVTQDKSCSAIVVKNDLGTIIEVNEESCFIQFDIKRGVTNCWFIRFKDLELLNKPQNHPLTKIFV